MRVLKKKLTGVWEGIGEKAFLAIAVKECFIEEIIFEPRAGSHGGRRRSAKERLQKPSNAIKMSLVNATQEM